MSAGSSGNSPPLPMSDSRSDSDENVTAASSLVCQESRCKCTLPQRRDSEAGRHTSGCATNTSDAPNIAAEAANLTSGQKSNSEVIIDTCCICLLPFTDQKVGTPQSCEHIFCFNCIKTWSKNVNTCPIDRRKFDVIQVRACVGGCVLRTEPVELIVEEPTPSLDRRPSEPWEFDWFHGPFTIHNSPSLRTLLF